MYAPFYRLQREPFSIAPDPRFLFMSEAHREALAHLLYGLAGGGGFVVLTGEIGAGKTTVCRCLLDSVPENTRLAYVFNPKLEVTELLQTICDEFGIDTSGAQTIKDYVDALNAHLLAEHAAGRNSVLVIDEAQSLAPEVLEQLRLLTNLETAERKLLQIVLIGQPELREMLARPELEQLAQRVIARYHLPALTEGETAQYVQHRLAVAGLAGESPFDSRALARLHALCRGVPRRINVLADRALLGGYAQGRARIDRAMLDQAAREVFDRPAASPGGWLRAHWPWAAALVAALAGVGVGLAWRGQAPAAHAVASPASMVGAGAAASSTGTLPAAASTVALPAAAAGTASATPSDIGPPGTGDEAAAWRDLAALWKAELPAGEACEQAKSAQLACFRGNGGLAQVRQLGRPALLTLRDLEGRASWAVLTALDDRQATLRAGDTARSLPLIQLAAIWRGEFATFWRTPPGWPDAAAPALAGWLAERLPGRPEQPLKARLVAFQTAGGLKADGVAGPMTLMQLNRASGVAEPGLNAGR